MKSVPPHVSVQPALYWICIVKPPGKPLLQERDVIVLPRRPDHVSKARTAKLTVQKTLEFSSQTLRSGVVVVADDSPAGTAFLFVRGAPGPIKDMVQPSSVPDNFDQVAQQLSTA